MSNETNTSSTQKLHTDDLKHLSEGEIYTDENGKKFRVKKSMLSGHFIGGPHGIGDPEDRTLRKIEADVVIPNRMNTKIEKELCHDLFMGLVNCMRHEGGAYGLYKCTEERDVFNACKKEKFLDPKFRQECTEEYIHDRAEARRTGLTPKERKLHEYREWKKSQENNKS
uniref:COX assembly mitochondrial protein n=1 Tax=Panagrolaimus sp. PS1159 TaxID=55785 RepID=A0AC35FHY8_9BILA